MRFHATFRGQRGPRFSQIGWFLLAHLAMSTAYRLLPYLFPSSHFQPFSCRGTIERVLGIRVDGKNAIALRSKDEVFRRMVDIVCDLPRGGRIKRGTLRTEIAELFCLRKSDGMRETFPAQILPVVQTDQSLAAESTTSISLSDSLLEIDIFLSFRIFRECVSANICKAQ